MARSEKEKAAHRRYKDSPKGRAKVRELKRAWARRRAAEKAGVPYEEHSAKIDERNRRVAERKQRELDRIVDAFLSKPMKRIPEHVGRELKLICDLFGFSYTAPGYGHLRRG